MGGKTKRINSISDFTRYEVICIYGNRPIQIKNPIFLNIVKNALHVYRQMNSETEKVKETIL